MTEIEKTEAEIKVLQKKLELLKEIENHKSPIAEGYKDAYGYYPDMEHNMNSFSIFHKGWEQAQLFFEGKTKNESITPSMVNCVVEGNPPDGYSYWNKWFKECGSKGILHNLKLSSKDYKKPEPYCPEEPEYYDEIEHDISENVENKTLRQVIDRWWMDTFTPKNQWDVDTCIDDLADQVEFWILRNKK